MTTSSLPTTMTRPHWGGDNSNVDQHIELYDGTVDSVFNAASVFRSMNLSAVRTTTNRSNNVRIDRLGGQVVQGRRAGEDINETRVKSDKLNVYVEAMTYVRNFIDDMDDWTAPDFWQEMANNAGTEFALRYDAAHISLLQKAPEWKAPTHLKTGGAFKDGFSASATLLAGASTEAQLEANAIALVNAHGATINELRNRRVPMSGLVTLVTTAVFSDILHHPKLLNRDFSTNNGDFGGRRVVQVNGVPIVEVTSFPTAGVAYTDSDYLNSTSNTEQNFTGTATSTTGEMITLYKGVSLVTVFAQDWTKKMYPSDEKMGTFLDHFSMWSACARRPDTVGVVRVTRSNGA